MTTHNISISIKVLTTGISIDINTESPQNTTKTEKNEEKLKLDDYEGLKKLLPLYDDIITHTECVDITADEETITPEDSDDEEYEEETDDEEEQIIKIARLN